MENEISRVGENLRRVRLERDLSLAVVAEKAQISVATLSRVETNKQNLDVALLLTLAGILEVPAAEFLGGQEEGDDLRTLSRRLARLSTADRTRLFLDAPRRRDGKHFQAVVDDLVATIDVLRAELTELQNAVDHRKKR